MSWQRDWPAAALMAAALILALPLWCVATPGMPDYPARLASFYLIGGGDAVTARFYHVDWVLVPNLASEVLVPLLAKAVGLGAAANLFLSAGVLMWVLGGGLLQRALYGRIGTAPLLGAFFAINTNFLWGFFNYYFAAGAVLLVFAAWVASAGKPGALRLVCFAFAATLVYFCHVFAAAILLLLIAGFETARAGWDRRLLLRKAGAVALVFAPSAFAFLLLRPSGGEDGTITFNLADTMTDRFEALIGTSFDQPAYALPIALLAILALALLLRRAGIHPAMWLALAALLLGTLLAPEWAMGGWGVHLRLPALFCAILFAATEFRLDRRLAITLAVAALALMAWNAVNLAGSWQAYDRQVREFRQTLTALPRGQRLMTVLDSQAMATESDQPYWHMAEFSIIDRGDMTSLMFTTKGQHVVQLNPPLDEYAAASAQQGSPPDVNELGALAAGQSEGDPVIAMLFPYLLRFQCHYDEAVVIHLGGMPSAVPQMLELRHQGSFFSLYDIKPDKACAP